MRKTELDLLRIFACFLVIVSHLVCLVVFNLDYEQWYLANFLYIARDSCVPLFYCISGILYLDKNKKISYKKIGLSIIKYFLLYILTGTALWYFRDISNASSSVVLLMIAFKKSILEPIGHLWFLPSMIGIYLCIPICRLIAKNEKHLSYYLVLWLIYAILKPTVLMILDELRLIKNVNTDIMVNFINSFTVMEFCGYIGYFLLGYWLYNFYQKKSSVNILVMFCILNIILPVIINVFNVKYYKSTLSNTYDYFSIFALLQTVCIVLFFKDHVSKIKWRSGAGKFISLIAAQTFGIYLIHPFFTERFIYKMVEGNILITIPRLALIIFIICFFIIFVIRNIILGVVKQWGVEK